MGTAQPPPDRIRVLWLVKGLGPGGAEQLLLLAAGVVDRDRFDYRVAYVRPDKTHLVPEFEAKGLVPQRLGANASGPALRAAWVADLRRAMADTDIVHAHSPVLASAARLIARSLPRAQRPVVVTTEHNEWTSHRTPTRLLNGVTSPLDAHHWAVSDQVKVDGVELAARGLRRPHPRHRPGSGEPGVGSPGAAPLRVGHRGRRGAVPHCGQPAGQQGLPQPPSRRAGPPSTSSPG